MSSFFFKRVAVRVCIESLESYDPFDCASLRSRMFIDPEDFFNHIGQLET